MGACVPLKSVYMNKDILIRRSDMHKGTVGIHGYKHAMVQIVAAAVSLNLKTVVVNPPMVDDTFILRDIILQSGGEAEISSDGSLMVSPLLMHDSRIDQDLSRKIHGSLYLVPAYASKFGSFSFCESGGCQIGDVGLHGKRPTSQIIDVMKLFGVSVDTGVEGWRGWRGQRLEKAEVDISSFSASREMSSGPQISGATKTALLCAPLVDKLVIKNPYRKTDVLDLLRFYSDVGFGVYEERSHLIVETCQTSNPTFRFLLSDCPSEVMTYVCLAVLADIELTLSIRSGQRLKESLASELRLLSEMGVPTLISENKIEVGRAPSLCPQDIIVNNDTIMSDHQPFFALMLTKAQGVSTITDTVWQNRFAYASVLAAHGMGFDLNKNVLSIQPAQVNLRNCVLDATDTRTAAALVLAATVFGENVTIRGTHHLFRGYASLIKDLNSLGAGIA